MARLIAGSSNSLQYTTRVLGVPTQATSCTVAVTDGAGAAVALDHSPLWDSTNLRYNLDLDPGEVPVSAVGDEWEFVWTWAYGGKTRRDVERAIVYETEPVSIDAGASMMLARLRDLISEESGDFFDDDPELYPALNEGVHRLFMDTESLPTLLADTPDADGIGFFPYIAAPPLLNRWEILKWAGADLTPISIEDYAARDLTETGTPTRYATGFVSAAGAPQVHFWPQPVATAAITGLYFAFPPEISASQGPTWHRGFQLIPCLYAASYLLEKDHRPESAARMLARFEMEKYAYHKWLRTNHPYRPVMTRTTYAGNAFDDRRSFAVPVVQDI